MDESESHRSGEGEAFDFLFKVLQERISRPGSTQQSVASSVCDLALSKNPLTEYFLRYKDRVSGKQVAPRPQIARSFFNGVSRVERPRRQRVPAEQLRKKRSDTNRHILQTIENNDSEQLSRNEYQRLHIQGSNVPQSNSQKSRKHCSDSFKAYRCIYCDKRFTTKGNARKHLEKQHVCKTFQQCDGCGAISSSVPKAKHHSKTCRHRGADHRTTVTFHETKDKRKVFGSEFTPGKCFTSPQEYVDHLLELSQQLDGSALPSPSTTFTFRALLDQPDIRVELQIVCRNWFGGPAIPQELEWKVNEMDDAIGILELGVVDIEPGPHEALRRNMVRPFLERLMQTARHRCAWTMPELPKQLEQHEQAINASQSSVQEAPHYYSIHTIQRVQRPTSMQLPDPDFGQESGPSFETDEIQNSELLLSGPQYPDFESSCAWDWFANARLHDFVDQTATEATQSLMGAPIESTEGNTIRSGHGTDTFSAPADPWCSEIELNSAVAPWLPHQTADLVTTVSMPKGPASTGVVDKGETLLWPSYSTQCTSAYSFDPPLDDF